MSSEDLKREAEDVFSHADLLYTAEQVDAALDRMAQEISRKLAHENPLVICPMIGGVVVTGQLITRLRFPLQVDYIHASRYRGDTTGKDVQWLRTPQPNIANRTLLIVDDILDEGITLEKIIQTCKRAEASRIFTAVLIEKQINRPRSLLHADFTGLTVPDRYVFGYGMDYKGYLRNCDGIYAVEET